VIREAELRAPSRVACSDLLGHMVSVVCNLAACVTLESDAVLTTVCVSTILPAKPSEIRDGNSTRSEQLFDSRCVGVTDLVKGGQKLAAIATSDAAWIKIACFCDDNLHGRVVWPNN
jgi:hypothetical protein